MTSPFSRLLRYLLPPEWDRNNGTCGNNGKHGKLRSFNAVTSTGNTALGYAIEANQTEMVEYLKKRGAK